MIFKLYIYPVFVQLNQAFSMLKNVLILFLLIIFSIILISCSASTGSRYDRKEDKSKAPEVKSEPVENFDMAPYHAKIEIEKENKGKILPEEELDIWYEYPHFPDDTIANDRKIVIDKTDGYRVQVFSTDNLEEADSLRSELYFRVNEKNVYLIFDPPFYKVKVGDLRNLSDANQLRFKLSQMGYPEARVVKDSINIFGDSLNND